MTTAVFDTLKAFSKLEAAGMETSHAKAVVDTLAEAFDDTVATKADIVAVRSDIDKLETSTKADIVAVRSDIDKLETSTKADIAAVKADIADLKADFKIVKYVFAPAVIILLLKIAFFS